MSFSTCRTSEYKIKEQPQVNYLSTIESTHVVLELLNDWNIENIEDKNLNDFLNPFHKMIEYQMTFIEDPLNNDVRFKPRNKFSKM